MLFLQGLAKYGKGDWRAISRNFVLSRTPTQVASHAQKFYNRLNGNNNAKKRRRTSIHDVTSASDIAEPSQWPITDYVTEAFDTGMQSLPVTDAIEGPSAVNSEKFPLGAAVGSELNSSFPAVGEFLRSVEDLTTVRSEGNPGAAEGSSGAWHGVATRILPSLSFQPSVVGGSGIYAHPVNNVRYDLEELMSKQLVGASQVGPTDNTASLPLPIATASSSGDKDGFVSTMGAPDGGFSVGSMQLPSIPGSSGSGTYPCWNPSSMDDNIFDLQDLFGLGK